MPPARRARSLRQGRKPLKRKPQSSELRGARKWRPARNAAKSSAIGDGGADEALQDSFDEERAADHPLGRADEAHDVDLFAIEQHRQADHVRDRECGGDGQHAAGDEAGEVHEVDQLLQLLHPLPVELDLVDAGDRAQLRRLLRECGRLRDGRRDLAFERCGKRILVELADDVGEVGEVLAKARQRHFLRNEAASGEVVMRGQPGIDRRDLLRRRVGVR